MNPNEQLRRFLEGDQEPTLPFVVAFADGRVGEAATPLHLMDLIIDQHYSDIDEIETFHILIMKTLKDLAASYFSMQQARATVYDALGPFYDNAIPTHEDEEKEGKENELVNHVILDGWDAWTLVASLIKAEYLTIYEKYPVWSDAKKVQGCDGCIFRKHTEDGETCQVWDSSEAMTVWENICPFVTNGKPYEEYLQVKPDEIIDGSHKRDWRPIEERKKEYIGYRQRTKDQE